MPEFLSYVVAGLMIGMVFFSIYWIKDIYDSCGVSIPKSSAWMWFAFVIFQLISVELQGLAILIRWGFLK